MLLDTMCNAFGGIILLAVLVTLLTSKESGGGAGAPDQQDLLKRRLSVALADMRHAAEFSASLQAKVADPRYKQQVTLLEKRAELRAAIEQSRAATAKDGRELETADAADAGERLKLLQEQLAAAEALRLQEQNSLAASRENQKRLTLRLAALRQQIASTVNESQRLLRLPKERDTGKRPFYIIVQYGRVYPCRNADLSRNEHGIRWDQLGESAAANPIAGQGYSPGDATGLGTLFSALPAGEVYLAFCVFEDSFMEFNRAKAAAVAAGLAFGWEPFRNDDGPVVFGPEGHRPKPQ